MDVTAGIDAKDARFRAENKNARDGADHAVGTGLTLPRLVTIFDAPHELQSRPDFGDGADLYIHESRGQADFAHAVFVEIRRHA